MTVLTGEGQKLTLFFFALFCFIFAQHKQSVYTINLAFEDCHKCFEDLGYIHICKHFHTPNTWGTTVGFLRLAVGDSPTKAKGGYRLPQLIVGTPMLSLIQ